VHLDSHTAPFFCLFSSPFLFLWSCQLKHRERFAIRSKYLTLDPSHNKYISSFSNIRIIQRYLVSKAEKLLIPCVDNTNVDRSVAAIHSVLIRCMGFLSEGRSLFDPTTGKAVAMYDELKVQQRDAWSSKRMQNVIRMKVQKRELFQRLFAHANGASSANGSSDLSTSPMKPSSSLSISDLDSLTMQLQLKHSTQQQQHRQPSDDSLCVEGASSSPIQISGIGIGSILGMRNGSGGLAAGLSHVSHSSHNHAHSHQHHAPNPSTTFSSNPTTPLPRSPLLSPNSHTPTATNGEDLDALNEISVFDTRRSRSASVSRSGAQLSVSRFGGEQEEDLNFDLFTSGSPSVGTRSVLQQHHAQYPMSAQSTFILPSAVGTRASTPRTGGDQTASLTMLPSAARVLHQSGRAHSHGRTHEVDPVVDSEEDTPLASEEDEDDTADDEEEGSQSTTDRRQIHSQRGKPRLDQASQATPSLYSSHSHEDTEADDEEEHADLNMDLTILQEEESGEESDDDAEHAHEQPEDQLHLIQIPTSSRQIDTWDAHRADLTLPSTEPRAPQQLRASS
jgi:hypothetical protein